MHDWYFYVDKGKTIGPFEREQIDEVIRSGKIGAFDLLYKEGAEKWSPSHLFDEFRPHFQSVEVAKPEDSWVVLSRNSTSKGVQYLQRGPFATARVKDMLSRGEVSYSDFVWREGQDRWQRISSFELFNPPPVKWEPEFLLPQDIDMEEETPGHKILEEVATMTRIQIPRDAAPPPEAVTGDLLVPPTVPQAPLPSRVPAPSSLQVTQPQRPRRPKLPVNRIDFEKQPPSFARFPQITSFRIAVIILVMGLMTFVVVNRTELQKLIHEKVAPDLVAAPAKPGKRSASAPVPEPPRPVKVAESTPHPQPPPVEEVKPPPEPRVVPTYLSMFVKDANGDDPTLFFKTNGSSHFAIEVSLVAEAGEVIDTVNVFKEFTIRWRVGETPVLKLKALELPTGRYYIEANINDVSTDKSVFFGADNQAYRDQLSRHKKVISLPFQRERRKLVFSSGELIDLALKLKRLVDSNRGQSSANLYTIWNKDMAEYNRQNLASITRATAKKMVFPTYWLELQDLRAELAAVGAKINQSINAGSTIDKSSLTSSIKELVKFKERAIELSLFR